MFRPPRPPRSSNTNELILHLPSPATGRSTGIDVHLRVIPEDLGTFVNGVSAVDAWIQNLECKHVVCCVMTEGYGCMLLTLCLCVLLLEYAEVEGGLKH